MVLTATVLVLRESWITVSPARCKATDRDAPMRTHMTSSQRILKWWCVLMREEWIEMFEGDVYGCCQFTDAVCCSDMKHCCPKNNV